MGVQQQCPLMGEISFLFCGIWEKPFLFFLGLWEPLTPMGGSPAPWASSLPDLIPWVDGSSLGSPHRLCKPCPKEMLTEARLAFYCCAKGKKSAAVFISWIFGQKFPNLWNEKVVFLKIRKIQNIEILSSLTGRTWILKLFIFHWNA